MNIIAPQVIRDYLLDKFKDDCRLSSCDRELIVPSIFVPDDYKRHMSINLDSGLWQCFKTGNKGNFIQIFAFLEGISYNQAESEILFKELDGDFTKKVDKEVIPSPDDSEGLELVPVTVHDWESEDALVLRAWTFLYERKLFDLKKEDTKYYVSTAGRHKNRLIIPFEEDEHLYFFQSRTLDGEGMKYLSPSSPWPKSSMVLYPFDETKDYVVVTEGPTDAKSLQLAGVNATCTMGSSPSEYQVEALKEFGGTVILGYDNDDAGQRGIAKFDYIRRLKSMADVSICHPPSEVKDWNEALMKGFDLRGFIVLNTKKYNYEYLVNHLLTTL